MIRTTALSSLLVLATAGAADAKPWKPHPIHIIPGVPLKAADIKPYVPRKLADEPPLEPSDVKTVEVSVKEAIIEMRPWSSPMVGNAIEGARLPVRGVVKATHGGCGGKLWYAVEPFGYLCSRDARPTAEAPTTESVLKVREGSRLPFQYVMVLVKDEEKLPMWGTLDEMKSGAEPERQLKKGDTVAIDKPFKWDGTAYWVSVDGKVIPQKGASLMGGGSEWHGLDLSDATPLPFGWVTPDKVSVYAAPPEKGAKAEAASTLERRTRVQILEDRLVGKKKWLRITVAAPPPAPTFGNILADNAKNKPAISNGGSNTPPDVNGGSNPPAAVPPAPSEMWISAEAVNEVRKLDKPKTVAEGVTRWIDVDLGEQVLVLYEADKPIYATLVSSGRAIATPMGTYPVWAKVSLARVRPMP